MSRPTLASALALAAVLGLSGCDRQTAETETAQAPPPGLATETPSLWRIEVLGDGGAVIDTVDICADKAVRDGFVRPAPEVDGQPCVRIDEAVQTDQTYSVRCRVDDQLYRVGASITGDQEKDFTVEMAVTRQDQKGPTFEQTRRYRLQGACPADWRIGDSARPGSGAVTDGVTGETRAGDQAKGGGE
ncbi:MAG: hypothetical protein ACK4YQ_10590 [Phenylobacterium sp.]|uniref:hypothetical protein n=1 Tax=Phenylobacterium sp. TaxID=1871053 RepID=UPI00391A1428